MRDFHLANYNKSFWLKELSDVKEINGKYVLKAKGKYLDARYITVFGTIIEIKRIDDKFILYSVDDGTGVIVCRYNARPPFLDDLEDWDWSSLVPADTTVSDPSAVEGPSMCDTVFNDQTIQQSEVETHAAARLKALDSLRWSIKDSFSAFETLGIGDCVCVHGKLYSYFGTNQIYVNVIRQISLNEELILMISKLEDSRERLQGSDRSLTSNDLETTSGAPVKCSKTEKVAEDASRRASGLMTFDTINPASGKVFRPTVPALPAINELLPQPSTSTAVLSLTTFDTFSKEEEAVESSDDDIIPDTPLKIRDKIRKYSDSV